MLFSLIFEFKKGKLSFILSLSLSTLFKTKFPLIFILAEFSLTPYSFIKHPSEIPLLHNKKKQQKKVKRTIKRKININNIKIKGSELYSV